VATILTRPWTAANGTHWDAVGFARVLGGAVNATVESNTGHCGAFAAERVYMVTGFPQTPGHKIAVDVVWDDAAGQGRAPGVGARWTDDGANGYAAQLDSNIDAARVRIRRRRSGAWEDLTGWVDVSGTIFSAALEAGVTLELRVVNEDGQVALSFRVNGDEVLAHDDTDPERIELPGSPAILIDSVSVGNDVTYDSLTVRDLEDEYDGDPAALDAGIALVVDGEHYSWDDLVEAGIHVGRGRQSYDRGDGWEFTTSALMDAEDAVLYPGAVVAVALDGTVVARGRVQNAKRALRPGEGASYRLVTARQLAADVALEHPETHANSITWNLPEDHAEFSAAYAEKEVGEAIKLILDEHTPGTTGLRAHLAAPPDEDTDAYVQAELDLLDAKVPAMSVSGDPVTAVEQLLAFTKYLLVIDPATLVWHFKPRDSGAIIQVDVATQHVLGEYSIDPDRNFTACLAYGARPEVEEIEFDSETVNLEKGWEEDLEATRTDENSVKNRDTGLVASIGGTLGAPTMTPDTVGPPAFSMDAQEWVRCRVTFDDGLEAGETYEVTSNTTLAFTLVGPWRNGGPDAGDAFTVEGAAKDGGRDNAYTEIGRRWKLADPDLAVPQDACVRIQVLQGKLSELTSGKIVQPSDPAEGVELLADLPAIGLVNHTPQAHTEPCIEGGVPDIAQVKVRLPTYSKSDPRTPRLWFPRDASDEDAYRGTAFTTDPAKWNGVGMPGRGDPAVMRPYLQDAPGFDGSPEQVAEWDKVFAEMLSYMGTLARSVVVTVNGVLDTAAAGLGKRLQVLGGPAELETITTLTILAVEWDPKANTTTYYAGTFAAGPYDIQRMRDAMIARNVKRRQKRESNALQKLADCLAQNLHSSNYEKAQSPTQMCAERMTSGVTAPQRSVKEDLTEINITVELLLLILDEVWEWIAAQKGLEIELDDAGNIWVRNPDGSWVYSTDGGDTWKGDSDGDGPAGGPDEAGDAPADDPMPTHPDDLGPLGIEGVIWAAIQGILGNLGKTIDLVTGQVVAPGTVNNGATNPGGHPWVTFGPDDGDADTDPERTPVPDGGTVPPTTETPKTPVLKNMIKTQKKDGSIAPPGGAAPGGTLHGPTGTVQLPDPGGFAPGSALSLLIADFRTKGLRVHDIADAGGPVFAHPQGTLFRVDPVDYDAEPTMKQVSAVGAGTGENEGDYESPATPWELAPAVHVPFTKAEGDGFDAETPADGLGLYLDDGSTTSIITDPVVLPASESGYDSGSARVAVVFRGDAAGDGAGNYRVQLYATWRPAGGAEESEVALGSAFTVANPGNSGQTVAVSKAVPKPSDGTPGNGTMLSIRVERIGGDAADTATDRLNVLDAALDVPVQAATIPSDGYDA
jgi:hypothetical protein